MATTTSDVPVIGAGAEEVQGTEVPAEEVPQPNVSVRDPSAVSGTAARGGGPAGSPPAEGDLREVHADCLAASTFKGAMMLYLESLDGSPPQWNVFQKVGYALIEDYVDDPEVPPRDASGARSRYLSQVYAEVGDAVFGTGWRARRPRPRGAERFSLSPSPMVRGSQAPMPVEHVDDRAPPAGGVWSDTA